MKSKIQNINISLIPNYIRKIFDLIREYRAYRIAKDYEIGSNYKRIYFFHVRKTGGTSINHMFLNLGDKKGKNIYRKVCKKRRVVSQRKIFVGWDKEKIQKGNYYYAFSHLPFHHLNLPKKTFKFTCLRDPIRRVLSLYKMLTYYRDNNINHPCMKTQEKWLGSNFEDFLEKIPQEELLNQLYMFSKDLNVKEAFNNITNLSYFFFTENFNQGVSDIAQQLQLPLRPIHIRKSSRELEIDPNAMRILKDKLAPEFELYNKLKEYKKH